MTNSPNSKKLPDDVDRFLDKTTMEVFISMTEQEKKYNIALLELKPRGQQLNDSSYCKEATGKGIGRAAQRKNKPGSGYPAAPLRIKAANASKLTKRKQQRKPWTLKDAKNYPHRLMLHRLVWLTAHPGDANRLEDVSHRCHNRNCANIDHLCLEPHAENWKRMGCPGGDACRHVVCCLKAHSL